MGVIVANNTCVTEAPAGDTMDKQELLELNDDQVEEIVAAHHRPGHINPPRCTMTLAFPPEEPVCDPWP
jgi:hypothetical protein